MRDPRGEVDEGLDEALQCDLKMKATRIESVEEAGRSTDEPQVFPTDKALDAG